MAEFQHLEELTVGLYDVGALKFSDFKFKVKPRPGETEPRPSPLYYNQRPLASFSGSLRANGEPVTIESQQRVRELIVDAYATKLDDVTEPYDHLYAIPQSMTILGGMVAAVRNESILWGRVGQKDYGAHASIEGHFQEGDVVYDLDDVLTSEGSKRESAESKKTVGLHTLGYLVMLDREESGVKTNQQNGAWQRLSVLGLSRAMDVLRDNGRIGQQEFEWVNQYHETLRADGLLK